MRAVTAANPQPGAAPSRPAWFYHAMALCTVLVWSFSFLHIIILNEAVDPVTVVVLRKDIFALLLIGLFIWRRPKLRHLTRRQWILVLAMSLVSGPLYHFTFANASGEGRTKFTRSAAGEGPGISTCSRQGLSSSPTAMKST